MSVHRRTSGARGVHERAGHAPAPGAGGDIDLGDLQRAGRRVHVAGGRQSERADDAAIVLGNPDAAAAGGEMAGDGIELGEFGGAVEEAAGIFGEGRFDERGDGIAVFIARGAQLERGHDRTPANRVAKSRAGMRVGFDAAARADYVRKVFPRKA